MSETVTHRITDALEQLALTLGESGAVPVAELVRALERAAERLRTKSTATPAPFDLVTQAEASRSVGVSRQAVNQWVRKGTLRTWVPDDGPKGSGPLVSLSEVAIAANRRSPAQFSSGRRRELLDFLELIATDAATVEIAEAVREVLHEEPVSPARYSDETRVLREFVIAAMGTGDTQSEFTADGVRLLAQLSPRFAVDPDQGYGRLAGRLGLLVASADGSHGFDSPATAVLGLLGVATVGTQYPGEDARIGRAMALAAREVWADDWPIRLYDAAFHVGEMFPSPLTRFTASLTYLDHNRFLRQAQASGISVHYSRGPGPVLPQRFYGGPVMADILAGRHDPSAPVWEFSAEAARESAAPEHTPSGLNPFRVFNYEYGLLDTDIHGIRRYCFSAKDARADLQASLAALPGGRRDTYVSCAIRTLARTISLPSIELAAIDAGKDFDWWKDHVIRSSPREILIGVRDEQARQVAHALLVHTSMLPEVVEAADADSSLRDRLRIYVKNLEFDVVDARYQDDLRRGVTRVIKAGGLSPTPEEAEALARAEIESYLA